MLKKLDNLHYDFRRIDSQNKPFNLIVSAREAGKTTAATLKKAWKVFTKYNWKSIFLRRQIADITDLYIESFQENLNTFVDENIYLEYKKLDKASGSVKIYCKNPLTNKKELFIIIIGMSQKIQRIKSNVIRNLAYIFYDEFIINPKWQESYLPYEFDKIKEAYSTFKRFLPLQWEKAGKYVKIYFFGNPYTVYSPFTEAFNVDYTKMKPDTLIVGDVWAVENYQLKPELVAKIQKANPFYRQNDEYTNYALKGIAINDLNVRLGKLTNGYTLKFIVNIENDRIGIYKNSTPIADDDRRYFCKKNPPENANKDIFCFSFDDLADGKILYNKTDNASFDLFKRAMRNNWVVFDDIGTYYKIRQVYTFL